MSRVVLTIFCCGEDGAAIGTLLRDRARAPVHQRPETVLGLDFSDAATGERVAGMLLREAIEVELAADRVAEMIDAVAALRRRLPFRWRTTPILSGGRVQ